MTEKKREGEESSLAETATVIFDALLRPSRSLASASCPYSPLRGAGKEGGEVRVFFPRCLPIAATALLFRVKREGFSGCRAESLPEGVALYCRR
ncbi:hypothetical protein LPW11_08910 [Geomonas sp. RF6]|uniref:hypothetical protein n=1 Tax=Geomonas sp. RF6 TaxID=2897342 RepID=UPI001E41FE5E|nr:hypothetical protein [Geomonas sp. RF6]UFS72297.1 hypothetical protein LPW11_08910 [Geomonas sp. RF6]